MAEPQKGNQQGQGEDWLWITLGIVLLLFAIWYLKHEWISNVWLRLKWAETWVVSGISAQQDIHARAIGQILSDKRLIGSLTIGQLWTVSMDAGRWWAIPFGGFVIFLGVRILMKNQRGGVKRKLDMDALTKLQLAEFPYIAPVLGKDLIGDKSPEWAPAMRPESVVDARGKLLEQGFIDKHQIIKSRLFDRRRAIEIFIKQVGRPWPGKFWNRLSKPERALFGVFAARIVRDKDGARAALEQMALNMGLGGSRSLEPGIRLAKKHGKHPDVQRIVQRHRYVSSVLAGMLEDARTDGILPPSEFLWLKPVDRNLWYLLNAVGRRVASVEASGSFANFIAEKVAYRSNTKRAEMLEKRKQKEAALQIAAEQNINIGDDAGMDDEAEIPELIVLTGPIVEEAVEALYQYSKEKDLCE